MDWDEKSVENLGGIFRRKYLEMKNSSPTDRRNFSAVWNKYLRDKYGATVLFNFHESASWKVDIGHAFRNILNTINFDNRAVADALVIPNPDREGQFILVPREMASRIIVLGML